MEQMLKNNNRPSMVMTSPHEIGISGDFTQGIVDLREESREESSNSSARISNVNEEPYQPADYKN